MASPRVIALDLGGTKLLSGIVDDQGVVEGRGEMKVRELQFHPPGLNLREVEDVVDQ